MANGADFLFDELDRDDIASFVQISKGQQIEATRALTKRFDDFLTTGGDLFAPGALEARTKGDTVRAAMEQGLKIDMVYRRAQDGASGTYRIRPTEVGPLPANGRPVLWAQVDEGTGASPRTLDHPNGQHGSEIHAFYTANIGAVTLTTEAGRPTWPTFPDSVGGL